LERLFESWPGSESESAALKAKCLGRLHADVAFECHVLGKYSSVPAAVFKAIRHDPSWVHNRGLLIILARACLGRRAAVLLRRSRQIIRQV
jgi:hypothetical protein